MASSLHKYSLLVLILASWTFAQQQCYFGPGPEHRGPKELVPCMNSGPSACCLLGDICLSGNACWNYLTGNTYQYGCTDLSYKDKTCPYKCGFNSTLSPWTALEYCVDVSGVNNTWVCHAPESCGCEWSSSFEMLVLQPRQCKDMGSDAIAALYAPQTLAPYVSLPSSVGGSTGYFSATLINSTSTWAETAISGYTPSAITQLTTYGSQPAQAVLINSGARPSASTNSPAGVTEAATISSSSASATATATETGNTTSSTASDSGLSAGAKAGIGAGIGGGALVVALFVMSTLFYRKQRTNPPPAQSSQPVQYSYPPGTPMPNSPYFAQAEKTYSPGPYSAGSSPPLPMMSPQFDPTYHGQYAQVVPSLYSEQSSKPPYMQSPTELSADHGVQELHSQQIIGNNEAASSEGDKK